MPVDDGEDLCLQLAAYTMDVEYVSCRKYRCRPMLYMAVGPALGDARHH